MFMIVFAFLETCGFHNILEGLVKQYKKFINKDNYYSQICQKFSPIMLKNNFS